MNDQDEREKHIPSLFATIHWRSEDRPDGYTDADVAWLNVIANKHLPRLHRRLLIDFRQRHGLTLEQARCAIRKLRELGAVGDVLYLNQIRNDPGLAKITEYQRKFNRFYRLRQKPKKFYVQFYSLMEQAAKNPASAKLEDLLTSMELATEEVHLSFCSKLLSTAREHEVIFDKLVASAFGVPTGVLPREGRIGEALRRHNCLAFHMQAVVARDTWAETEGAFDAEFPEAQSLSPLRKADLMIWANCKQ
jgi:hypothetical protein